MRIPGCWKCLIGPFSPRCCALGPKGLRLETEYVSCNTPNVNLRLIEPHTLIYTGMRWRVRAYCEKNGQYRDFVLSRPRGQPDLLDASPNTREQETDFGMAQRQLVASSRRALVNCLRSSYWS